MRVAGKAIAFEFREGMRDSLSFIRRQ